jgi:ferredoxin-NADP reductase
MEEHIVKIINVVQVTHDVKRFKVEKPSGYKYIPGQATEVSINRSGCTEERRPFTFTGLNEWDFLEFTIKIYDDHNGVTKQLNLLNPGDELLIHDVWGTISYKGPGVFIAGGAGVTPFIAIFRDLSARNEIKNSKLIFANKTRSDIIMEKEFRQLLGSNFINILSHEKTDGYAHGLINEDFLKQHINGINGYYYLCGPEKMMDVVEKLLISLNIDKKSIVKEEF